MRIIRLASSFLACALSLGAWGQLAGIAGKVSPGISRMMAIDEGLSGRNKAMARESGETELFVRLTPGASAREVCSRYGATLTAEFDDNICTVRMNRRDMARMAADDNVVRMEAEPAPRAMMDTVAIIIGADRVYQGKAAHLPQAFTGKGVVTGIVDVGFDYWHPMFYNDFDSAQRQSRIKWVGDYISTPDKVMTDPTEIHNAMCTPDPAEYHGTHVAGIAAGSEIVVTDFSVVMGYEEDLSQREYLRGIAWESDLAFAGVDMVGDDNVLTADNPPSATIVRAFSAIFQYAESLGQPCVINFSAGAAPTFASSRELEEEVICQLVKDRPGRAIVVAAGNSGAGRYLMHKPAMLETGGTGFDFAASPYLDAEVKMQKSQSLRLRLTTADYQTTLAEIAFTPEEIDHAASGYVRKYLRADEFGILNFVYAIPIAQNNGDERIYNLLCQTAFNSDVRLLLTIQGTGESFVYGNILTSAIEDVATEENHSLTLEGYSMAWPASIDGLITVGSTGYRYRIKGRRGNEIYWDDEVGKGKGYIANTSSTGPTLDGRIKPDVVAPGVNIKSALNTWSENMETVQLTYGWVRTQEAIDAPDDDEETPWYYAAACTGTSMAAPVVAGTIALWMEADPTLTTERVKEVIAASARQPDDELEYPNNLYGYGEIDAYRGLLCVLGLDRIESLRHHLPAQTAVRLSGRKLSIDFEDGTPDDFTVRIFSASGVPLLARHNEHVITLDKLPAGIYAVSVETGSGKAAGATLIRW